MFIEVFNAALIDIVSSLFVDCLRMIIYIYSMCNVYVNIYVYIYIYYIYIYIYLWPRPAAPSYVYIDIHRYVDMCMHFLWIHLHDAYHIYVSMPKFYPQNIRVAHKVLLCCMIVLAGLGFLGFRFWVFLGLGFGFFRV